MQTAAFGCVDNEGAASPRPLCLFSKVLMCTRVTVILQTPEMKNPRPRFAGARRGYFRPSICCS